MALPTFTLQTSQWWLLRCLCMQQQILDDKSNTMRETVKQLMENSKYTQFDIYSTDICIRGKYNSMVFPN